MSVGPEGEMELFMYEIAVTVLPVGGHISLPKVIIMLVLVVPWFWAAPWVQHDLARFRGAGKQWAIAPLVAGIAGVLLWLLVPFYLVGVALYVVLTMGVYVGYVVWRNKRVADEEKVGFANLLAVFTKRDQGAPVVELVQRVNIYDSTDRLVTPDASDASVITSFNCAQELVSDMIASRASRAEIAPSGEAIVVRVVIDGQIMARPDMDMSPQEGEQAIQFLKSISGMNVEDLRRPQEGSLSADLSGKRVDLRVESAGTTGGQRMHVSVLQEIVRTNLDELGMGEDVLARVKAFTQSERGLLIVSGRPQSGMTSTMYSILRKYDAFLNQLVTLESKPSVDLENITQNKYGDPRELPKALTAALRRSPDVLLIDRCGDEGTAQSVLEAASAMPVTLGVHASNTFVALAKWVKLCGDATAAVKDLQVVLYQTLARRLCPDCREGYRPDHQLLAKANLTGMDIDKFYRVPTEPRKDEKGNLIICQTCRGSGYFGRVGVFEMLELNDEVRQLVVGGAPLSQIRTACRKNKMLYLQEQALRKVVEGVTGIKEVIRVTQQPKKST